MDGIFYFKTSQRNNRKTMHSFALRSLTSKLQQEVLKFDDNCVSWSSRKTDRETKFQTY